jgi:hypothetical protein
MTATIGHNSDAFTVARDTVNDALLEARAWCDGAAVADQEQADGLAGILDMLRKASKAADEARKIEAKPFDDGKAEVQARYKPLLTDAERAIDAVKAALAKWQAEQKRKADEAARIAREAAEKAAQEALEARRAADLANLAEREKADAALAEAERLAKAADAADKVQTGAKGMFAARATALITKTEAVALEDAAAALKWMKEHQPHFLKVALLDAIHKGRWQNVPGVTYETTHTVR